MPWKFDTVPLATVISDASKPVTDSLKTTVKGIGLAEVGSASVVSTTTVGEVVSETTVTASTAVLVLPASSHQAGGDADSDVAVRDGVTSKV